MIRLAQWILGTSGFDAAADLRGDLSDFAPGSRNLMPDGQKQARPFRGLTAAGTGGRRMFQLKDTWGSLADDGSTPGKGSLFSTIADMLVYIGQGKVYLEGVYLGVIASNVLKFLLKWNGSYTDANSGPYAAGLPEPLAPVVGIVTDISLYGGTVGNLDGTVSIKTARLRKPTGGRSRASATSDVLTVTKQAIYAVAGTIVSGQTHHVFFGTSTLLGGIGLHYRIATADPFTQTEYLETDVERNIVITSVTGGDKLNAATGTFAAGDIAKLVENVSGFVIPAGTTIVEIVSSAQVRLSVPVTSGAAGTVKATSYVNGIRRAVLLNWTPADLVEETAWTLDFPPPTGSHAFQLESLMVVAGYADASTRVTESSTNPDSSASSSNPGTALLASLNNQFESYDPRYPVYLPEPVIDILSDGMDAYKFAGGKNGVYAVQYLNVTNATPLTLTVLLRGEGIQAPHNWCARDRAIYLYTAKGQPCRIVEGGVVDKTFGAKVRREMRNIAQADMVIFPHPEGGGVVYASAGRAWFFDELTDRWSTELGLNDDFAGNALAACSTQSRALVALNDAGTVTAYYFDEGAGSYVIGTGHYQNEPEPTFPKIIQRIIAGAEVDRTDRTVYVGIHINTRPTHEETGTMAAGSNVLACPTADFNADSLGGYVLVRGAAAAGRWLRARIIEVVSPTVVKLGLPVADLGNATALNASLTVTNAYVLLAHRIYAIAPARLGSFEVDSGEMFIPGCMSYSVSMVQDTAGGRTQPLYMAIDGIVVREEGWNSQSAAFIG